MKKNIAIIILVITNLASLVYAFAQATIAEQSTQRALVEQEIAIALADSAKYYVHKAEIEAKKASAAMVQADKLAYQLHKAQEALANCK